LSSQAKDFFNVRVEVFSLAMIPVVYGSAFVMLMLLMDNMNVISGPLKNTCTMDLRGRPYIGESKQEVFCVGCDELRIIGCVRSLEYNQDQERTFIHYHDQ